MLLKLVNDISSIKATLQSNHTLRYIDVQDEENNNVNKRIQQQLGVATMIIRNYAIENPEAAGSAKDLGEC
jgi:hypothetical protein